MTGKQIGMLAAGGSAALLMAAFAFQALGYAPCAMCIWQRYPHAISIAAGVLIAFGLTPLPFLAVGVVAAATTSGIGVYHTGVERDWWQGPTSCTGSGLDLSNMPGSELLPSALSGRSTLVMCDEVAWEFLNLSMASWNALWSAVLSGFWVLAMLQVARNKKSNAAATSV